VPPSLGQAVYFVDAGAIGTDKAGCDVKVHHGGLPVATGKAFAYNQHTQFKAGCILAAGSDPDAVLRPAGNV